MFKPKPLTPDAIGQLTQGAWYTPERFDEFREAIEARNFKRALDCCRHSRVDDLIGSHPFGRFQSEIRHIHCNDFVQAHIKGLQALNDT